VWVRDAFRQAHSANPVIAFVTLETCSCHTRVLLHLCDVNSGAGAPAPGPSHSVQVWNVYRAAHSTAQRAGLALQVL
jgi:hypothetical protein